MMNPSRTPQAGTVDPPVKCLIVDDLAENLLAMAALLRDERVEVLTAQSGPEALEILLVNDIALAFLDVQMPGMDGFELAELMRGSERTRHVPIIFLTAGARDQHRLFEGYEAGGVDFIYKPIEPAVLKNKSEIFFALARHKERLARQLEERTRALHFNEMFTAILGHDLRNPLAAIVATADLALYRAKDEASKQSASRILASANRMNRMINDLLDVERARLGGGIPIVRKPVDLCATIATVVKELQSIYAERQIRFECAGNTIGDWDADRLAQVVTNLSANALTHGAAAGHIALKLDGSNADQIILSVSNDGTIATDRRDAIFDPFVRGSSQKVPAGLGLGLYIVQQIVIAHGGTIRVSTSSEQGTTTFIVCLPRN